LELFVKITANPESTKRHGMISGMKPVMALSLAAGLLASGCVSPLYRAAEKNDIKTINELLDQGADVNKGNGFFCRGGTALKVASSDGRVDMVKLLLDRGADVNLASGDMGWTALSCAAWSGNTEVAMFLIERGADINKAIAGLNCGLGTGNAIAMLNVLKHKTTTSPNGQPSPAMLSTHPAPPTLSPPVESAAPF
jgi:hypothetical protein